MKKRWRQSPESGGLFYTINVAVIAVFLRA